MYLRDLSVAPWSIYLNKDREDKDSFILETKLVSFLKQSSFYYLIEHNTAFLFASCLLYVCLYLYFSHFLLQNHWRQNILGYGGFKIAQEKDLFPMGDNKTVKIKIHEILLEIFQTHGQSKPNLAQSILEWRGF